MAWRIGMVMAGVVVAAIGAAVGMDSSRFPPERTNSGGFANPSADFEVTGVGGDRLVIHEWGTFTSLHDEVGEAIGGINVDDEPAPGFVHRIANYLMIGPAVTPSIFAKGTPRAHPHVTMRLETPVVYFYPPRGAELPLSVDVDVAFRGGWLSEYYPDAEVEAPGVGEGMRFGPITRETVGRLRWQNLQVGVEGEGPETDSEVWLAPRRVPAAMVRTAKGESERFLFYRGVGRLDSPLSVSRDDSGDGLVLMAQFPLVDETPAAEVVVPKMWLVDIRADRACAFRELDGFRARFDGETRAVGTTAGAFGESDFDAGNINELAASMHSALVEDGLYPTEADALLETWRASYFESAGLRLFYLLPRAWIDRTLPLEASVDAEVVRTMVGRVEIVTPEQRRLLGQIAAGPASDGKWRLAGLSADRAAAPEAPADIRAYRELGRFRNALVLDEVERRPTPELKKFVKNYGLHGYRPVEVEAAAAEEVAVTAGTSPAAR